ncbi:MAG: MmgE/PrpD family protein [Paracoccaceae bacterium]|nr:MmgE/PrpD family protein [Paracoccaceae bacterium]
MVITEAQPVPRVTCEATEWIASGAAPTPAARIWARHALLDWLGVTIAGMDEPLVSILREEMGRPGSCTLIGGGSVDPHTAALINGAAGHALDYDDVVSALNGHPTAPVAPAVLALAEETKTSGAAVIDALIVGVEVEAALGAMTGGSHYEKGFHATGTLGTLGAAAGCARLLGLDAVQTSWALGIAASQAAGLKCNFGTMTKPFHVGKAAANGLLAARLAARGFTANPEAIEASAGLMWTQAPDFAPAPFRPDPAAPMHVEHLLFKYHAACYLTHAPMNAIIALRERHGLTLDDMAEMTITVSPRLRDVCNIQEPATGLEVKFSLRHTGVLALAGAQTASLDAYTDEVAHDPELVTARGQTRVAINPDRDWMTGHVAIHLTDGRVLTAEADAGQPASDTDAQWDALGTKFSALVPPVLGADRAQALIDAISGIEQMEDIGALMTLTR